MSHSWFHGFAAKGTGSLLGDDYVRVGPLGKINFLVGRNNHGKSTVLRAVQQWVPPVIAIRDPDPAVGTVSGQTLVPVSRNIIQQILDQRYGNQPRTVDELIQHNDDVVGIDDEQIGVWTNLVGRDGFHPRIIRKVRQITADRFPSNIEIGGPEIPYTPPSGSVFIPAFRQLRPHDGQTPGPDFASGQGLITELASWQRPVEPSSENYKKSRARWSRLREFVQDVLEDPEADIEVAVNQADLHVQLAQAGRMLKIDHLGDGIKQVLMIAASCVYYSGYLICLEEPEIHLHAGLQRKLLRFLATKTDNQYLIATHSAHALDIDGARIFHVTHDGRETRVSPAIRASDVRAVCQDLGYMASDLLQANYTIWVEGPSDRLYWRRWLELVDPDLEEGVHFTIMVYGGYLITTLRVDGNDEPSVASVEDDLINLLRLGRACTLITDSDKATPDAELKSVVLRLREEAEHEGSGRLVVCEWVRTVENLLPREKFREVVMNRHKRAGMRLRKEPTHGAFSNPFAGMSNGTYSKVRIAKDVTKVLTAADMDPRLVTEVEELSRLIRSANGLPSRENVS